MSYPELQGALITRAPHEVLKVLKRLVDTAEEKIRLAERETVAVAIGHRKDDDPLRTWREVVDTCRSEKFDEAVSTVREKTQNAVDWHLRLQH